MKNSTIYKLGIVVLALSSLASCNSKEVSAAPQELEKEGLQIIAFGSCNKQDSPQPLWEPIISHSPELFIWLGDNIYGDTDSMAVLKAKYELQDSNAEYQKLKEKTPIIGIWDDHDFGKNDAGKEYPYKKASRDLMYDFLDVPTTSPLRAKEGAYGAYSYGSGDKEIKVILLDARYFRDSLGMENRTYLPNESGTILGEEQWEWLEKELAGNTAKITLIGSGIQIVPKDHQFEKWANFPYERERLLNLVGKYKVEGLIFLSGDRHIAEISEIQIKGISHPVFEITSSGLTHTWREYKEEPNQYRTGDLIAKLNFGILKFDWQAYQVEVGIEVRGELDSLFLKEDFIRRF